VVKLDSFSCSVHSGAVCARAAVEVRSSRATPVDCHDARAGVAQLAGQLGRSRLAASTWVVPFALAGGRPTQQQAAVFAQPIVQAGAAAATVNKTPRGNAATESATSVAAESSLSHRFRRRYVIRPARQKYPI
jgi:hypothetical protein